MPAFVYIQTTWSHHLRHAEKIKRESKKEGGRDKEEARKKKNEKCTLFTNYILEWALYNTVVHYKNTRSSKIIERYESLCMKRLKKLA